MEDAITETEGLVMPEVGEVREGMKGNEEGKRERLIDHLISTLPASLGAALSPKSKQAEEREQTFHRFKDEGEGKKVEPTTDDGGGGGGGNVGTFNSFISKILHSSEGGEEEQKRDEKVQTEVTEAEEVKKEAGGGGLIDNLASHLPISSDDAVLEADEAAILIHSIIHD